MPLKEISKSFGKSIHTAGVGAWLFLLILILNFMQFGSSPVTPWTAPVLGCVTEAQQGALDYLEEQARHFVDQPGVVPDQDWRAYLRARSVDYREDLVLRGLPLTWKQVAPGLPPEEVSGTVDASAIASPGMARYLEEPSLSILPRSAWPAQLLRTRVRAEADDWQEILVGLFRRRIITFLADDELIVWGGQRLLNGAFGVPKLVDGDVNFDPKEVVLRLIINLQPSNQLQRPIVGDMAGLPLFSQWGQCQLLPHECYLYSAEDQVGAFHLYKLAAAWLAWFALAVAATPGTLRLLGVSSDKRWPAMGVIPMGWLSATGVMQHLAVRLCLLSRGLLPVAERPPELSRSAVCFLAGYLRVREWADSYLDDNGMGEVFDVKDAMLYEGIPSAYQLAMREVFEDFGVARSTKKAVVRCFELLSRGARLDGRLGRATPSPDKLLRFIGLCWYLFSCEYMYWADIASVGGQAVFLYQFRRCAFVALVSIWDVIYENVPRQARWGRVAMDLLSTLCLTPLLFLDFRLKVSDTVSCSDASEQGGGVTASRALTKEGSEFVARQLAGISNIATGRWALVESFAGIGSGRLAAHRLGLKPALYVAIEKEESLVQLVQYHWPEAVVYRDVRTVCADDFVGLGSGLGHLQLVVHIGGSPCPGLCRWNPFHEGAQHEASVSLLQHMRRVTTCLREAFPHAVVEEAEENVASMSLEDLTDVSDFMGVRPYCFDSGDLRPQRRRRFFWASWGVQAREEVRLVEKDHYTRVELLPASRPPLASYLDEGWAPHELFDGVCPTLTRPCAVAVPRFHTPGDNTASTKTLAAWRADQHRRPPINYEDRFKLVRTRGGQERYRNTGELERLAGFDREYTLPLWKTSLRKQNPEGFRDARESGLGNAYDPDIVAFLLAELAWSHGLLRAPLSVEQLVHRRVRLLPTPGTSLLAEVDEASGRPAGPLGIETMTSWILAQQSARGGEVRNLKAAPHAKGRWQEVNARWFRWRTVLSVPWKWPEAINVAEARAHDLAVRLRARVRGLQRQRFVHLMDSQVNLACVAKGRTGSYRIRHVQRRAAATLLATGLHEVVAYVRSDRNPADRASRDHRRWAKHRKALVIKKAVSTRSQLSRGRSARPSP